MSAYELRDYQRECLTAISSGLARGRKRLLISLPTGTGKTVIFARFPEVLAGDRRLLVLTHRLELIEQTREKLEAVNPGISVSVEQAERRAGSGRLVVGSIQTLARGRVQAFDPSEFWGIVVDEAHHAVAPSYRRVIDHFGPDARVVGFTATPRRGDSYGLGSLFEEISYSRGLSEMINSGWLSTIKAYRVSSNTSLDDVATSRGDFAEGDLSRTVCTDDRNALIVRAYLDKAVGRRSIVFCAGVTHAQALAADFAAAGVRAVAVWGEMPFDERRSVIASFRNGNLDVVTNCGILTEGYDDPAISCVLMARPTKSTMLYTQMIGRGTRRHPGKSDLLVLDVVDNSRRHSLTTINALFDLPLLYNPSGGDVNEQAKRIAGLPWTFDRSGLRGPEDVEAVYHEIDLLKARAAQDIRARQAADEAREQIYQRQWFAAQRQYEEKVARAEALRERWSHLPISGIGVYDDGRFECSLPSELAGIAQLAWIASGTGEFVLPFGRNHRIVVRTTLLGGYEIELISGEKHSVVGGSLSLSEAIAEGETAAQRDYPDKIRILSLAETWRSEEPTDKQLEILRGLDLGEPISRGTASYVLSSLAVAGVIEELTYRKPSSMIRIGVIKGSDFSSAQVTLRTDGYSETLRAILEKYSDRTERRFLSVSKTWWVEVEAFKRMEREILEQFRMLVLTTDVPRGYSHDTAFMDDLKRRRDELLAQMRAKKGVAE